MPRTNEEISLALRAAKQAPRGNELEALVGDLDLRTLHTDLLNELLVTAGHTRHQQIAFELQHRGDPSTVAYAEQALSMGFGHLQYTCSEDGVIAKWFSWLLACIDTPEATSLLRRHARSDNPEIAAEMSYRLSVLDECRAWKRGALSPKKREPGGARLVWRWPGDEGPLNWAVSRGFSGAPIGKISLDQRRASTTSAAGAGLCGADPRALVASCESEGGPLR